LRGLGDNRNSARGALTEALGVKTWFGGRLVFVGGWFLVLASRSFCLRLRSISFQFSAAFVLVCLRFFLFACHVSFGFISSLFHAICALGSTRICALVFLQQKIFGGVVFSAVVVLRSCTLFLSA
jgi:hypothetical protein